MNGVDAVLQFHCEEGRADRVRPAPILKAPTVGLDIFNEN